MGDDTTTTALARLRLYAAGSRDVPFQRFDARHVMEEIARLRTAHAEAVGALERARSELWAVYGEWGNDNTPPTACETRLVEGLRGVHQMLVTALSAPPVAEVGPDENGRPTTFTPGAGPVVPPKGGA